MIALVAAATLWVFWKVSWRVFNLPLTKTDEVFGQMQMLFSALQATVGVGAVLAAISSSRTSAAMAKHGVRAEAARLRAERGGRINALVGAAIEAAAHAGALAKLQDAKLNSWRRILPDSSAELSFAQATWNSLVTAVSTAAKALEHLRYGDDDLLVPAERLFNVVVEMQHRASQGDLEELVSKASEVRTLANELWSRGQGTSAV